MSELDTKCRKRAMTTCVRVGHKMQKKRDDKRVSELDTKQGGRQMAKESSFNLVQILNQRSRAQVKREEEAETEKTDIMEPAKGQTVMMIDVEDLVPSNENFYQLDDSLAVEKLQEKLDGLKKKQERMKAVNAYYRKHKTLEGCPELSQEETEELKKKMLAQWHYQDKPYQSWELSNNNQNIHAAMERLETLKRVKEKDTSQYQTNYFKVVENTRLMRLQLFFDEKPETEIREALRQSGFRWSPKNHCWQRQLTENAKYSLRCLIKCLERMAGEQAIKV